MKTKYIILLYIASLAFNLPAHEQIVHEAITCYAAQSAINNSAAFSTFLNTVSSDRPLSGLLSGTNFMRIGSFDEDFADENGDVGGYRSYNHFYDPLDTMYGKGLSDESADIRGVVGTNSFAWGSVSNCMGINYGGYFGLGGNLGTFNIWSWQNARGYGWLGLTATNKADRQAALDNMFRSVGQVMHLLQDTTSPQHVRNEQQLDNQC